MMDTVQTPATIERRGAVWVARDDLYRAPGDAYGAKARVMTLYARMAAAAGAPACVAAVARNSSIPAVVARVAEAYGLGARLHTADAAGTWWHEGEWAAAAAAGAAIVRHRPGYMTVIGARARNDAAHDGAHLIPFGLMSDVGVAATATAVGIMPPGVRRLVVPVGSGAMLSGILHGLARTGQGGLHVLGVTVGASPLATIERYAPEGWRRHVTLVPAGVPFFHRVSADIGGLRLDPYYEAKCLSHLRPDDCLWVVALRSSEGVPLCAGA